MPNPTERRRAAPLAACLLASAFGCEPSDRERKNRQEFEALLSAVSLRNTAELEKDGKRIDARHASGELSDGRYHDLRAIISQARTGDWAGAEARAYAFREARPYFQ